MPILFAEHESTGRGRDVPRLTVAAFRLVSRSGPRRLRLMLGMELVAAASLAIGVLLGRDVLQAVLSAGQAASAWGHVLPALVGVTVVSAVATVANAVARRQDVMLSELVQRYSMRQILEVTCAVELAAFDDPDFHDLLSRAQRGSFRAPSVVQGVLGIAQASAGAVAGVAALAFLQPLLLLVCVVAAGPVIWLSRSRAHGMYRFAFRMTPSDRERHYLASLLSERASAQEVRAMSLAGFLRQRYEALYDRRIGELDQISKRQLHSAVLAGLASSLVVAGAVAVLVALALAHDVSIATVAAAASAMILFGQRVAAGSNSGQMLLESAMFLDDYLAFAERKPQAPATIEDAGVGTPLATSAPIVADDVWFSYPGGNRLALRGVSLRIEPGEVVALVGANGSGKTTLAKLMAGLYLPDRGRISLHGIDTAAADRTALRQNVAVVFQDFLRYWLSARDNIAMGRYEHFQDDARVHRAAERAGAHDELAGLPDGYATRLGPAFAGGTDLSVGQWQKIAIARLFFRDAPFVILDEPTAALDAHAEHDLFTRINELLRGRSVLLISHRFSSVRGADRIYVLDHGQITEQGTHAELLARGGTYSEMFTLQAAAYAESAERTE